MIEAYLAPPPQANTSDTPDGASEPHFPNLTEAKWAEISDPIVLKMFIEDLISRIDGFGFTASMVVSRGWVDKNAPNGKFAGIDVLPLNQERVINLFAHPKDTPFVL